MQVTILFFGQLTDVTGTSGMLMHDAANTDELLAKLDTKYPLLKNSKFVIAVDKKIISSNTLLHNNSTIALMPPFSGG
jgi:sulfur-carrier protein